ncbi:MAG: hypothetical protein JXL80_15650 [Planctomycetes bacterium]|nr:hypothetical protein [Planctomycetota bacterium]
MKATAEIEAGVCGFKTRVAALCDDDQYVTQAIETDCEKIGHVADALNAVQPLDAFQEINPAAESVLLGCVRQTLKGCCAGCAVPTGLFKAMQVAAGLALPADIAIRLSKDSA